MKNKIIITIEGYKFDITSYVDKHPGGASILKKFNGKENIIRLCELRVRNYVGFS